MLVPDGQGGPHVFVADLEAPELDADDRHHLDRVLRTRPGDPITLSDGAGRWRTARFGSHIEITGDVIRVAPLAPAITIGFAPVKGTRPEWVVQKLTELGVDRIVPFHADRSVVRWTGERGRAAVERLRRVAREGAMQCRRVWLPTIDEVTTLGQLVTSAGEGDGIALAERGGEPLDLRHPTVLVGPEGGWTDAERGEVVARAGLGPHILRAETAAVAAAVLLGAARWRHARADVDPSGHVG